MEDDEQTPAQRDAATIARLKKTAGVLLLVLATVSFSAGVPGLVAAGGWAQLGGLSWLLPILVDGGLVFFAVAAMSWRAETGKAAVLPWLLVIVLTGASFASQVTHVLTAHRGVLTAESIVGAVVASLFPLVVLASTRSFELLRFGRLVEREARRAAKPGRRPAAAKSPASKPRVTVASKPTRATIDPAKRAEALARVEAGESQRAVADALGVSRGAIQNWQREAA